jgi:hypothetical protein
MLVVGPVLMIASSRRRRWLLVLVGTLSGAKVAAGKDRAVGRGVRAGSQREDLTLAVVE